MKWFGRWIVFCLAGLAFFAPLKFGTPVIAQSALIPPNTVAEWVFFTWPQQLATLFAFGALLWLVLDGERLAARVDFLFVLPLLFLASQSVAAPSSIAPQTTADTLMAFAVNTLLFYAAAWYVRDGATAARIFGARGLATVIVMVMALEQRYGGLQRSREYAASRGATDVEFTQCGHRDIPYADGSFDVVMSHDVLEHVADPLRSMQEIYRVLRPGGLSVNIFPLYLGAYSHHLDYIARLPGLHWFFSPAVLVQAVNGLLEETGDFGTAKQPAPRRSFDGARDVLPGLNGLSGEHLPALLSCFEVISLRRIALGPRGMGMFVRSRLPVWLRDCATATIACVLRKPDARN